MRTVSTNLETHKSGTSTTTCKLLKITLQNGDVYGCASLDIPVDYDDGTPDGEITYAASRGFDVSTVQMATGSKVANAEARVMIPTSGGITEEMIEAGELDDATWNLYEVNFKDLTPGDHVDLGSGDVGNVARRYGMLFVPELLSLDVRLKQPIGYTWSRRGRCIFGSPAASQTGCGVDVTSLWVDGEVVSVGAETGRTFVGTAAASPYSYPGRVLWLTGANAGKQYGVESSDEGSPIELSLIETTAYPIEVGDQYRIRPDCLKRYVEDCIGVWNNGPNFKGEPHIPADPVQVPGAQVPG